MQATIEKVFSAYRPWGDKYPENCSVQGLFTDGSRWELGTKISKADEHANALLALSGKECEFDCEPKPDYEGKKQWKMVNYPGKPQKQFPGGGGGGGRAYVPSWTQSEEGERYTQERMDRRTALMQAMGFAIAKPPDEGDHVVLALADHLYEWLRQNDQKSVQKPSEPMRETAQVQTPGVRPINEGPDKCACGAPAGKPHASKCQGVS